MSYNIVKNPISPVTTLENWAKAYKEQHVELSHDQSMLTLATPDDSVLVVGPPRLVGKTVTDFYVIGLVNSFQYNEQSQVQPMKAIGSRRHIFSRTNAPVSGTIGRMVVLGKNLARALYSLYSSSDFSNSSDLKFSMTGSSPADSAWYTNMEEDLFRYPVGLGVIYKSPLASVSSDKDKVVGAEYLECCVLNTRSVGMQTGMAMIMEQVSFMADRIIPWQDFSTVDPSADNPAADIKV